MISCNFDYFMCFGTCSCVMEVKVMKTNENETTPAFVEDLLACARFECAWEKNIEI